MVGSLLPSPWSGTGTGSPRGGMRTHIRVIDTAVMLDDRLS
jgi:hypothetical protein